MKITDNPDVEEFEPEFKYSSSMHGDEVTGLEMCLRLIQLLVDQYGTDPTITSYVDGIEIWICPLHNPDGYVAVSRENANGVNLNRDFPDPVDDPYDDPSGRQPETQAFMYFGYDHRFVLSANYHGGALVMNYPWDSFAGYTPDDTMIRNFALGYSVLNPPMWNSPVFPNGVTIGWEWYIIHGGMQDWCYNWRSDIDITIEVSDTKWPPYSQMDSFWDDNRDAMLWYMGRSLIGINGFVTDADSGAPLDATIDVLEIGKTIRTGSGLGDYHRLLEPGTYTLYVEAIGHLPQTIPGVVVIDGPATRQDIAMEQLPTYVVSGTVTEEGSGEPLAATVKVYIHDTQQFVVETETEPADGFYSLSLAGDTYDLRVSSPDHIPETRMIEVTGDRTEDFVLPSAEEWILVVQDGATTGIASDLSLLGFDVMTESDAATEPASWSGYRLLVWSAGSNIDPVADPMRRTAIESYIADGGTLLIEGGQVGYDTFRNPGYHSFGATVLHGSDWEISDAGDLSLVATDHAIATTPNALPAQFVINYQGVADNDAVIPLPDATLIYGTQLYPADAGILAFDDDPNDPTDGRIVFYAFNYDALIDAAGARNLLENTVRYLDRFNPAGVEESEGANLSLLGPAFPNPASRIVRFRLTSNTFDQAAIYDLEGRRVRNLAIAPSSGATTYLTWDGKMETGRKAPTGVYFIRLSGIDSRARRSFLWLR